MLALGTVRRILLLASLPRLPTQATVPTLATVLYCATYDPLALPLLLSVTLNQDSRRWDQTQQIILLGSPHVFIGPYSSGPSSHAKYPERIPGVVKSLIYSSYLSAVLLFSL